MVILCLLLIIALYYCNDEYRYRKSVDKEASTRQNWAGVVLIEEDTRYYRDIS